MELEQITSFLFTVHMILLCIKIWSTFIIFGWLTAKNKKRKRIYLSILFLFSSLMLSMELYFMYAFFIDLDLYFYEYVAVLDEVIFTIIAITYLKKEETNG